MPNPNKAWELIQILETASDASLNEDLLFLVNSSEDELSDYLTKNCQVDDYTIRDALNLTVKWLEEKKLHNKKIQFYVIKNACAALYFKRHSELSIEEKENITNNLQSLYESIKNSNSLLKEERENFLSSIYTTGKAVGQFSANTLNMFLIYGGVCTVPFILMYTKEYLTGEKVTPEERNMYFKYAVFALRAVGLGLVGARVLGALGVFNRTNPTENLYVAPPVEVPHNDNSNKKVR